MLAENWEIHRRLHLNDPVLASSEREEQVGVDVCDFFLLGAASRDLLSPSRSWGVAGGCRRQWAGKQWCQGLRSSNCSIRRESEGSELAREHENSAFKTRVKSTGAVTHETTSNRRSAGKRRCTE